MTTGPWATTEPIGPDQMAGRGLTPRGAANIQGGGQKVAHLCVDPLFSSTYAQKIEESNKLRDQHYELIG